MTRDEFEHFDAAYALGALSGDDRERFEAHLESCDACAFRVAQLWNAPDLLALAPKDAFGDDSSTDTPQPTAWTGSRPGWNRLQPEDLGAGQESAVPDALLTGLLRKASSERRRRKVISLTSFAAAAAAIVALMTVVLARHDPNIDHAPSQALSLVNVSNTVPIQAKVQVVQHDSWDQVNLWCAYNSKTYRPGNYEAVARDKSGRSAVIGTWPVIPGQTAVIRTPTQFHAGKITTIEIVDSTGKTLSRISV